MKKVSDAQFEVRIQLRSRCVEAILIGCTNRFYFVIHRRPHGTLVRYGLRARLEPLAIRLYGLRARLEPQNFAALRLAGGGYFIRRRSLLVGCKITLFRQAGILTFSMSGAH